MVEERIVIAHVDSDGMASAAIALRKYPDAKLLFAQPHNLPDKLAQISCIPSVLIIVDVAIDRELKPAILEQLKRIRKGGGRIIYVDHHRLSLDEDVVANVDEFYHVSEDYSSSFATAKALKVEAPDLIDLGMLGDRILRDPSHPLYKLDRIIGKAIALKPIDDTFRKRVVRGLSIGIERVKGEEELMERARLATRCLLEIRREARRRIAYEGDRWFIVNFSNYPLRGLGGHVAADLADEEKKLIFFVYKPTKVGRVLVLGRGYRESEVDVGMLLSDFAMKLGGSGGGHSLAAAARVPKLTCDEVVEKLASRLKAQC